MGESLSIMGQACCGQQYNTSDLDTNLMSKTRSTFDTLDKHPDAIHLTTSHNEETEQHIQTETDSESPGSTPPINAHLSWRSTNSSTVLSPTLSLDSLRKRLSKVGRHKRKVTPIERDESYIETTDSDEDAQQSTGYDECEDSVMTDSMDTPVPRSFDSIVHMNMQDPDSYSQTSSMRGSMVQHNLIPEDDELIITAYRLWRTLDVKDRILDLKIFKSCFVGRDVVTFLMNQKICWTQSMANEFAQKLIEKKYIQHADDGEKEEPFKGGFLSFYVFVNPKYKLSHVPVKYNHIIGNRFKRSSKNQNAKLLNNLYTKFKKGFNIESKETFGSCFVGKEAVDWILRKNIADTRNESVQIVQLLVDKGMVKHVTDNLAFADDDKLFCFVERK